MVKVASSLVVSVTQLVECLPSVRKSGVRASLETGAGCGILSANTSKHFNRKMNKGEVMSAWCVVCGEDLGYGKYCTKHCPHKNAYPTESGMRCRDCGETI